MKVLLSWLKDYVDFNLSAVELADKLNVTGTEVDSVTSALDEKVIVAKILKIEKHPNADRLQIATVFDGKKELTVVCGAPNIYEGQIAPLAQVGAKLQDFEIKKSAIRGVESEGMLCAQDELGLGDDHSGIIDLPKDYEIGKSYSEYLSSDAVFELEITPNRGDCLSHIGIAREIAAFCDKQLSKKPISLPMSGANINDILSIEIADKELCPQYMARVLQGVKVAPSPKWLQDRLVAIGQKPINNIVDATNYIMFDLGQPLHAFDADKIEGKKIIVRKSKQGEKITSLDGTERALKGDLVISDERKAIAIAGIMGGRNSEVTDTTTSIILESAEFNRKSIRKSKKELGMPSEASYRFERGIDSGSVEYALNKAAHLINEIAGGRVLSGIAKEGERPDHKTLKIEYSKINKLAGLELPDQEINHYLKNLGFEIDNGTATVPLWRHDIELWQDLTEEVARLNGYDKITPIPVPKTTSPKKSDFYYKEAIKNVLIANGFVEALNYPYLSEKDIKNLNLPKFELIEIANPIQPEYQYLRNSLAGGLLKSVAKNPSFDQVSLFEIGHVFKGNKEETHLGIITAGKNAKESIKKTILALKNIITAKANQWEPKEVSKDELNMYKIRKGQAYYVELSLSEVKVNIKEEDLALVLPKEKATYRPVSRFPSVTRDLAFIVDKGVKSDQIKESIYAISELINRVELFDEFASDKLGKDKKNLAYHIYLQKMDRTMTDKEADEVISATIKKIELEFKAKLRS